jgi:hypothetical protein
MQKTPPDPRLKNIARISKLLDSQFKIGGFRFGLDPIINFVPFLGDASTTIVSLMLIYTMRKHGASSKIVVKMLGNVFIDFAIGAIPLIGLVFDFYFKSNNRNLKLLEEYYLEDKHAGSGKGLLFGVLVLFIVLIGLIIYATVALSEWFLKLIF